MRERHIFFDLLHLNKPSDAKIAQTYGMEPLRATIRTTYAGWTDETKLPPGVWYDNLAANAKPPHGWVAIDHEAWPGENQKDRKETATKFATVYKELKSRRPDLKFGFYGYGIRVHNTNPAYPPGTPQYTGWQKENDDYAEMDAVVDALFPTLYFWFTEDQFGKAHITNRVPSLFNAYCSEARRMLDTYGKKDRPVYPYIWWRRHDAKAELNAYVWEAMFTTAMTRADGCVLWGGYQQQWDANAWWLPRFLDRIRTRTDVDYVVRVVKAKRAFLT